MTGDQPVIKLIRLVFLDDLEEVLCQRVGTVYDGFLTQLVKHDHVVCRQLLRDPQQKPDEPSWYGLRMWVELGFRALKSLGWQWQRTRRTDPAREARYWLILAMATWWVLAYGTRCQDRV